MIRLFELLAPRGLDLTQSIKMVRHEDKNYDVRELRRRNQFLYYQGYQSNPVFDATYLVSFLGLPHRRATFLAAYKVLGRRDPASMQIPATLAYSDWHRPGRHWYDLEELSNFADLTDRVIIDWGAGTRSWVQWLKDREVVEVLPVGYVGAFPGYLDFVLPYRDLKRIIENPIAHREWHRMLGAVAGVYLILDQGTGKQYVGSAAGSGGILQRWTVYAKAAHGGNVLLRQELGDDAANADNLQFSILQTLPLTLTIREVNEYEALYKRKLGTRAHGLNLN